MSPTDAVAATAIGKRLGLPHRLMTVLEGESLLNDASALVVLRTALLAITAGFSLGDAVFDFVRAVALALVIGYVVGHATVWLRSKLDDPVLATAVSFIVPFLAFLPAEEAEASGVVAVVVAGVEGGSGHRGRVEGSEGGTGPYIGWRTQGRVHGRLRGKGGKEEGAEGGGYVCKGRREADGA